MPTRHTVADVPEPDEYSGPLVTVCGLLLADCDEPAAASEVDRWGRCLTCRAELDQ